MNTKIPETNRLFNEYGAAINTIATNIDDHIDSSITEILEYCARDNIDLRDVMGYCIIAVTNRFAEAILQRACAFKKKNRMSLDKNQLRNFNPKAP